MSAEVISMDIAQLQAQLSAAGGPVDVRKGSAADGIDGVVPSAIVEPARAADLAAALAWAADRQRSVVVRGSGTKNGWGRPPRGIDLILSTRRLNQVVAHRAGDLTATVEAGATLGDLNRALGAHGQWLPIDPVYGDRSTIGGLLATNDSGPSRHRFGTPRDLVIGIQVATVDGRLAKAGGQVVKNVAGYDLSKLMSGSFGALAAIVSATFKLSPVPPASATLVIGDLESGTLARLVETVGSSQLEPVSFEVHAESSGAGVTASCLLRFASFAAAVEAQVAGARAALAPYSSSLQLATGDQERDLWRAHSTRIPGRDGAVVRASWQPSNISGALGVLTDLARDGDLEMIGRLGVGAGLLRIDGNDKRHALAVERLRSHGTFGNVVLLRASTAAKALVDVWGTQPNRATFDGIKHALDPSGTLGAGRGPF
jgi:glycolate dehydrogenase FAD-binding subunit